MTILEKIAHLQHVWRVVLPHITEPSPEDAAHWCSYPLEAVESAILRTGKRFSKSRLTPGFDPHDAHRYATAVARSMAASP
jgi:hypothetical protein